MKKILLLAAGAEAATGTALVLFPSLTIRLLFGAGVAGVGEVIGRIAGIALIGLGVACWPVGTTVPALRGMVTYGVLVTAFLAYVGVQGASVGLLLWGAVGAHTLLVALLLLLRFRHGATGDGVRPGR